MRKLWKGWIAALVCILVTASAGLAQPAAVRRDAAESQAWWGELLGFSSAKKGSPKPITKPTKADKAKVAPAEDARAAVADKAEQYGRAYNAFLRRQEVIDRLRQVAADTNDAALEEEAARLEEMARRLFQRDSGKTLGATAGLPESDDQGDARDSGRALRAGSPGGVPARARNAVADSPERSAGLRGGER